MRSILVSSLAAACLPSPNRLPKALNHGGGWLCKASNQDGIRWDWYKGVIMVTLAWYLGFVLAKLRANSYGIG